MGKAESQTTAKVIGYLNLPVELESLCVLQKLCNITRMIYTSFPGKESTR